MILKTKQYHIQKTEEKISENTDVFLSDFIICYSEIDDSCYEKEVCEKGFRFLDRILNFEINTNNNSNVISVPPDINIECCNKYDKNVFDIAHEAYTTDRRFHLEPIYDQKLANEVIDAHISYYKGIGCKIYKAFHDKELLGFSIVDNSNKDYFENVLAATKPGIKGKVIAAPLYAFMIFNEQKKYVGQVSSSNVASINLHIGLGGKVTKAYDAFVLDNRRK